MEIPRSREVVVLAKGDTFTVNVDAAMAVGGWRGGQGVKWAPSTKDELLVTYSDGLYAGFALWGANEVSDKFTAMTENQPFYRFLTLATGNWIIATTSFEQYTWQSRQAGPLVPITYTPSDRLVFSNRGLYTKQDEWSLSGDPRGANQFYLGFVAQAPVNGFLTVQVSI